MKTSTKIVIATGAVILTAAIGIGGHFAYRHFSKKPSIQVSEPVKMERRIEQDKEIPKSSLEQKADTIQIASFNIQVFGKSKRNKPEVMKVLTDIVHKYDITAIQEFRDKEEKTLPFFVQQLNLVGNKNFSHIGSPRLGRTSSKERYAFVYDPVTVEQIGKAYVWPDTQDIFEREPYIAYFKSGDFDYVLINIHTKPDDATNEIMALETVVNDAITHYNEKDIIVLGDFNADGSYFNENIDSGIRSQDYFWVINDSIDTTVAKSDNTYDRIVFLTQPTSKDYAEMFGVFRFDSAYVLTPEFTKKVSDHYPVYAVFNTNNDAD